MSGGFTNRGGASGASLFTTGTLGENVNDDFVALDRADNLIYVADPTDPNLMTIGWVDGSHLTGESVQIQFGGVITPGVTMLANEPMYLGRNGLPTWLTNPTAYTWEATNGLQSGDWIQPVGRSVSTTKLALNIQHQINQVP